MKFAYKKIPVKNPRKSWVARPFIYIRLKYQGKSQKVLSLIDSGADVCVFHSDIAEILEIDLTECRQETYEGISGQPFTVYFQKLQIEVLGLNTIALEVGFSDVGAAGSGILGQRGFFDNYQIRFEKYKNQIEIFPRSSSA